MSFSIQKNTCLTHPGSGVTANTTQNFFLHFPDRTQQPGQGPRWASRHQLGVPTYFRSKKYLATSLTAWLLCAVQQQ